MKKEKLIVLILIMIFCCLPGCAPMISGAMNASENEKSIACKTAEYFNTTVNEVEILNHENQVLSRSYQTKYKGNIYNCTLYYGVVKCSLPGHE